MRVLALSPVTPTFLLLSCLLLSCSGRDGSSVAEITGSGSRQGDIQAFGSVVVQGERFSIDSAEISVDGVMSDESALQIGMVVGLEMAGDGAVAAVDAESSLIGTVRSVSIDGLTFELLGQTVTIDARTVLAGFAVGDLIAGDGVRVFASASDSGEYTASVIERFTVLESRIVGLVDSVANNSFRIGNLTVETSAANIETSSGVVEMGMRVLVVGSQQPSQTSTELLVARQVVESKPAVQVGAALSLSGVIRGLPEDDSMLGGERTFTVNGVMAKADAETITENRNADGEPNGTRVAVFGRVDRDSALKVERLVRISDVVGEVETTVTAIGNNGVMVFDSLELPFEEFAQIFDERSAADRAFLAEDVRVGDRVEIRIGEYCATGSSADDSMKGEPVVSRLTALDARNGELLVGAVTALSQSNRTVDVYGVRVLIDDGTLFETHVSEADFYDSVAVDDFVEVELTRNPQGRLVALEIGFKKDSFDADSAVDTTAGLSQ